VNEVLAIIPARGGSKGVPRKNVRLLTGRPLICHSISHALRSGLVTRTVVSTDDAEIAEVSRRAGAEVVQRPALLSADSSPSEPALLHVLDTLRQQEGYRPELVVFLQATSPIRADDAIDEAIRQLGREQADSLVSVCASHDFLWTNGATGGEPVNYDPARRPRRQDMKPQFRENGSIYVMRAAGLQQHGCRIFGRVALFEQPMLHGFQIDTPEDFRLCETVHEIALARTHTEASL